MTNPTVILTSPDAEQVRRPRWSPYVDRRADRIRGVAVPFVRTGGRTSKSTTQLPAVVASPTVSGLQVMYHMRTARRCPSQSLVNTGLFSTIVRDKRASRDAFSATRGAARR
ncbi:MAG: hypothetical protein J2P17_33265 [Mycobacterium sp.]|nr:hypothetical protein [Mycobacterium sp.]